MKIPNSDQAVVDIQKLRGYCLNPNHPRGRHKARVFAAALGFTANNAEEIRAILLSIVQSEDAVMTEQTEYGQLFTIDFLIKGTIIRSSWIILNHEKFPRLVTCYVI